MKELVKHPVYGEIVYDESFWSGKKTLTINGTTAQALSKTEFMVNDQKAQVKGNLFTGVNLYIEGETVQLSPKASWFEIAFAILPFVFLMVWGNSAELCEIFPVVGGAIGGALGGFGGVISLYLMKQQKARLAKAVFGILMTVATVFIAFILAVALLSLVG